MTFCVTHADRQADKDTVSQHDIVYRHLLATFGWDSGADVHKTVNRDQKVLPAPQSCCLLIWTWNGCERWMGRWVDGGRMINGHGVSGHGWFPSVPELKIMDCFELQLKNVCLIYTSMTRWWGVPEDVEGVHNKWRNQRIPLICLHCSNRYLGCWPYFSLHYSSVDVLLMTVIAEKICMAYCSHLCPYRMI